MTQKNQIDFRKFSKNTGCRNLSDLAAQPKFSKEKSYDRRKSCICDFLNVFYTILTFVENYPSKSEILVSIGRAGYIKFLCIKGNTQNFLHEKL